MTLHAEGSESRADLPICTPLVLGWLGLFYGVVAGVVLAISLLVSPEAIALGEPWRGLGVDVTSCVGCALCGMSRAFSLFSHGQFLSSLSLNPLVVVAWPATLLVALGGPFAFQRRNRRA